MTSKFEAALAFVLANEGGYVNDADDPGGATKFGITVDTLSAWRGMEATTQDVENLTLEEATEIYWQWYWLTLRCDELPEGVGAAIFDSGVLYGTVTSAKLAQETANALGAALRVDGILGPLSRAAIASQDPTTFVINYSQNILSRIAALVEKRPRQAKYRAGWEARARKLLTLVQS